MVESNPRLKNEWSIKSTDIESNIQDISSRSVKIFPLHNNIPRRNIIFKGNTDSEGQFKNTTKDKGLLILSEVGLTRHEH